MVGLSEEENHGISDSLRQGLFDDDSLSSSDSDSPSFLARRVPCLSLPDFPRWVGSADVSSGSLVPPALSRDDWIAKILVRYESNVVSFWDSVIWTLEFSLRTRRIE